MGLLCASLRGGTQVVDKIRFIDNFICGGDVVLGVDVNKIKEKRGVI